MLFRSLVLQLQRRAHAADAVVAQLHTVCLLYTSLTANTVIHYHANIRKCLQYAFQIGMIRSNPADRVERPRKEKFKSEIYSGEELEQLFTAVNLRLELFLTRTFNAICQMCIRDRCTAAS